MRLLITGGAGFIGINFIMHMVKEHPEYKILNVDKLTYASNADALKDLVTNPNYSFVKADICNERRMAELSSGVDSIINFAAESHVDRSIDSATPFIQSNIVGTHSLLEAARKNGCKFLQISTDEVYGSINAGAFKETDALRPNSPYSASKASAEMLVHAYEKTYDLDTRITRSSNNFGPYQNPEKFIPKIITNALSGKKIPVYGIGANMRDWIFVEDNCRAIDLVLEKGKSGETYNIGAGNEWKNIDLVKKILDFMGKPHELIEFVNDRPGHDFRYAVDSSKIMRLGWTPANSFESALRKTIKWYSSVNA